MHERLGTGLASGCGTVPFDHRDRHQKVFNNLGRRSLYVYWALALLAFGSRVAGAQDNASLSGFVTDAESGESLILANIFIEDLFRGASTNTSGYYAITGLPAGQYRVRITYVGYQTIHRFLTFSAGEQQTLDIQLVPIASAFDEIVVTAEQMLEDEARNVGVAALSTETIKLLPAVFEPDVFRTLQLLPGIKAASDYSSGLYVRGGNPGQTNILLDRTKIYNPSHFFGVFSTFNPDAIKDVRLFKGGFPASYGGSLGSVLDVTNKDGNRRELHGTLSLGLLASRGIVEGPHPKGSFMFAARRSTLEPLLQAFKDQQGIPDRFYFYDLNAKVNFDLTRNDILSISGYRGADKLKFGFATDVDLALDYGNSTITSNWTHLYSETLLSNFTITNSAYFSIPKVIFGGTEIRQENRIYDTSFRGDLQYYSGSKHDFELGFWGGQFIAPLRTYFDQAQSFSWRRKVRYASAYLHDTYKPSRDWIVQAGLRGSYLEDGSHFRLEPRLSVEYQPQQRLRLQAAAGRYYQYLTLVTNESFSGFDFWLTSAEGVQPAYGDQYILGVKATLGAGLTLDTEVYYRTMRDLFKPDPFLNDAAGFDYADLFLFGRGWARGFELLLQRNRGRFFGFVAYTLGRTERTFPTINMNSRGIAVGYPPKYDRLHDLKTVISYDLGRRWVLSTVFTYATGQAVTKPTARYHLHLTELALGRTETTVLLSPSLNAARLPAYHRLDAGIKKTGRFFGLADYELQTQVINAYKRRNIWFIVYDADEDGGITETVVPQIPIPLPNLSFLLKF